MGVLYTNDLRAKGVQIYPMKSEVNVPDKPVIRTLNSLLHDIYVRYIALKDEDVAKYYAVFEEVFFTLHDQMKEEDAYYETYSGPVQVAGSHFDKLRINKPDEFDMDIVIGLPVNDQENPRDPAKSDVVFEEIKQAPAFVRLKMGARFQNLPNRDKGEVRQVNQIAYRWLDDENYLLRSLFMDWFKGVVDKGMNLFEESLGVRYTFVEGVPYALRLSASGPAYTLIIENPQSGFKLDVDLVPALKFPEDRWPISKRKYRKIPKRWRKDYFTVVPKPMKGGQSPFDSDRSWRIGMHMQEKELMHDAKNMKQAIRLIKKLRDSQGMDKIASYYIKTIFFHEAMVQEPKFWSKSDGELFTHMVKRFLYYLEIKNIPYFWNPDNNLIGDINESTLVIYANKLKKLIKVWEDPRMPEEEMIKNVAKFLLTERQFEEYSKKVLKY